MAAKRTEYENAISRAVEAIRLAVVAGKDEGERPYQVMDDIVRRLKTSPDTRELEIAVL